ncbi:MAG: hypothetical protein AAB214_11345 [Fibrobacterota bacterium]
MSDFLELLRRLRTEAPDWSNASRYARGFGWICLGVGAWNLICQILYRAMPMPGEFQKLFRHPLLLSAVALIALSGGVSLLASGSLRKQDSVGVLLAKLGLVVFGSGIVSFLVFFSRANLILPPDEIGIVFRIFMILVGAQFLVPLWFAYGYLDRLKFEPGIDDPEASGRTDADPGAFYREGLTSFGPGVMLMFTIFVALLPGLVLLALGNPQRWVFGFFLGVPLSFLGAWGWNEIPSSFQKTREVLASYRTGISLMLFNASPPFCKLLVYGDGLEVRIEYNRYFIPYDRMDGTPRLEGALWWKSIVFRCDLPDVPRKFSIQSYNTSRMLECIRSAMDGSRL